MDATFREEIASGDVIIYMDDILIATKGTFKEHQALVTHVLQKLQDNDLFLKPEKCHFHKKQVEYLGVIVGNSKVKMDPVKVKAITDWPTPTTLKKLVPSLDLAIITRTLLSIIHTLRSPSIS